MSWRMHQVGRPAGRLLGREQDVVALRCALEDGHRLVAVTGGPGVGKTRLAIEVVAPLDVPSAFVAASDAASEEDLIALVMGALELRHQAGQPVMAEIARALGPSGSIVVLDDLDAFDGAEAAVQRLLDDCTGLQLVVTSRSPIGTYNVAHHIEALAVDGFDHLDPSRLVTQPAIALFCDRALEIDPGFALDTGNAATIASICERTQGIPLAIELTAARLAVMSPEALLVELDRTSVLAFVGGALRDSIERSWALLTPSQQSLAASMSLLVAPAPIETIQAVSRRTEPSATSAVIDDLTRLVDLHVVDPDRRATDRARFGLPTPVAAIAREHLDRSGGANDALTSLIEATAAAARDDAESSLSLDRPPSERLLGEFDNTRVAVEAALRSGDVSHTFVVQLVVDTAPAFFALGESRVLSTHLATVLDREPAGTPEALRAVGLAWLGRCESEHTFPPDREALTQRLRQVLELCPHIDEPRAQLDVLVTVAEMLPYLTDPSVAADAAAQGLQLATEVGDEARRGRFLSLSGAIVHNNGSPERAAEFAVEAIAVGVRTGDDALVARASLVLRGIDRVHRPVDAAEVSMASVVERARRSGDRRLVLWSLGALGLDQVQSGDEASAAGTIIEVLELAAPLAYTPGRIHALLLTTLLAASRSDHRDAARTLGSLSLVSAVIDGTLPPSAKTRYRAVLDQLISSLGENEFRTATTEGAAMSWHDALDAAQTYAGSVIGAPPLVLPATGTASSKPSGPDSLTPRELDVLRLLATGATNKTIAAELGLRPKTVMHHNESIYRKLRVRGRAAAVSAAIRSGVLGDSP